MIQFACPGCAQRLRGNTLLAGKTIKCPKCARSVVVPAESTAPAAARIAPVKRDLADEQTRAPQAPAVPDVAESATVPPADTRTTAPAPKEDTNPANNPGSTQEVDVEDDRSLTDFLAPPQQPGEIGRLGVYRVLKILGAGGMGVVFKAEDPGLQRLVAIKAMLPAIAASAAAKKRFLREARAAAAINHNHIVTIFQVGEDRGIPFLAMQFLEGESLDERLKRENTLPLAEVLRIGREMAEGMTAAHERGLIHRDIKPANTWLEGKKGIVKILDFGLARSETDQAHLTQSGAIIGTPAYMSPEQGRGGKLDARCDLWSLGVMLYRMCTGELPFKGEDTVSTLMSVAMDNPRPPVKINAAVPAGLSKLIMKLLEKDPARRIASAHEVAEELRSLEQSQQATQTSAAPSTQSVGRKLPSAGQTLTFVGRQITFVGRTLLTAGTIIGKNVVVVPLTKALKRAGSASDRSVAKRGVAKRSKKPKLVLLAVALVLLIGVGYGLFKYVTTRNRDGNQIARDKDKTDNGDGTTPLKDSSLELGTVSIVQKFVGHTDQVRTVALSGDGKRVLTGSSDNTASLWDAADGKKIQTFQGHSGEVRGVALSADGKRVLSGSYDMTASLWDAASGKKIQTFLGHSDWVLGVALSGDGKYAVSGSVDKTAILWDAADGKKIQTFQGHTSEVGGVAVSGDGKLVLTGSGDGKAILWDAASGNKLQTFQGHTDVVTSVALSGDGKLVLTGSWDKTASLWDAASGKKIQTFAGHTNKVLSVALSEGGRFALTGSMDYTACLWATASSRKIKTFEGHTAGVYGVAMTGDARRFITGSADNTAILWEVKAPVGKKFINSLDMAFALVPRGRAWVGGSNGQVGTNVADMAQDFYLGIYEVTQEEWQKIMGKNPSVFSRARVGKEVGDDELKRFPVENVTWEEAQDFVKLVNERVKKDSLEAGWEYRLPTEQQWEYACRGGPMTDRAESAFDFYLEKPVTTIFGDQANSNASDWNRPCKVGSYPPNRLGLHDMHGNVWEWCENPYDPSGGPGRVSRGGGFLDFTKLCSAASRSWNAPSQRANSLGLRLARVPSAGKQ